MEILQTELSRTQLEWNTHRMQRSGGECPAGKPDLLFSNPQVHGNHYLNMLLVSHQ